jgi:serine/threonine-protein kinase HipA
MVFNAVIGNDDDHPRNHAAIFDPAAQRWRLSPAFDVVPNPDETPAHLTLQVSAGTHAITRATLLADAIRFGFSGREEAGRHLDALLVRIGSAFDEVAPVLTEDLRRMLTKRVSMNVALLS